MFTKYFGTVKVHKNRFVELLDPKFIIDLKHVVCILHQDSSLEVKFCYTSTTKAATIAFFTERSAREFYYWISKIYAKGKF